MEHIATTATHESKLTNQVKEINDIWAKLEFNVIAHGKDTYKLEKIDEIITVLDESLSNVSDI